MRRSSSFAFCAPSVPGSRGHLPPPPIRIAFPPFRFAALPGLIHLSSPRGKKDLSAASPRGKKGGGGSNREDGEERLGISAAVAAPREDVEVIGVMRPEKITEGVYIVGGPEITSPDDCCVYLVDLGRPILVDAGAGRSAPLLARNLEEIGYSARDLSLLVLTHCHIDHVGGAGYFMEKYGVRLAAHELDAQPLREGDKRRTAAQWYGVDLKPLEVGEILRGEEGEFPAEASPLRWLHTPGHTPGSISLYLNNGLYTVLFGQDIHGPFYASFGSDLDAWAASMRRLLELQADILCEGHFGIIRPASEVRRYIEDYLRNYGRL